LYNTSKLSMTSLYHKKQDNTIFFEVEKHCLSPRLKPGACAVKILVISLVSGAVSRFGKMEELLTDRGFVFYSWRGINRFEKYLESEGIDHTHARPHHPQTLGKVEALNKRIQQELFEQQHFSTLEQAASALEAWVEHYNHKRPHQGLGGLLVPAERFHGQADQVLDQIARACDVTGEAQGIERSIANLVLAPDGTITLFLLGQPIMVKGGPHV